MPSLQSRKILKMYSEKEDEIEGIFLETFIIIESKDIEDEKMSTEEEEKAKESANPLNDITETPVTNKP